MFNIIERKFNVCREKIVVRGLPEKTQRGCYFAEKVLIKIYIFRVFPSVENLYVGKNRVVKCVCFLV